MSSAARPYDIVVFGATGFTGQLVVRHLAQAAPEGVRWAVAGRNPQKLASVLRDAGVEVPVLHADVSDPASLRGLAESTRVVLTTVGPYVEHGPPLVAACVAAGADYVDITGEPEFVEQMIDQHHAEAAEKGLRIVSCCGFDSIPHDLGAYFTVQRFQTPVPIVCRGFVRAAGQASGGTWHSAIGAFANARKDAARRKQRARPSRPTGRRVRADPMRVFHEASIGAWAVPLPTIDPVIVRRSAAAMPAFGPDFTYGHYVRVNELPVALAGIAGVGALAVLAQVPPAKALLLKARARGEGPSESERAQSWFNVRFIAEGGGQRVVTEVAGGDPGYDETSKMIAESALCLVLDRDRLPPHTGVITPAMAMGNALIERLRAQGLTFDVIEDSHP
ncbi:MAG: saccharopine dehydrogenase NADP-binding domain-containing protein [Polyangiales bacterium]|nr:saccharopine dehydrogenase NADP-binding domain-containing protein [Myxococcales bacterium]MCB9659520.1 saccharopine dehydrogenase NADP-binding domain-containing protein [Sandaracinaceae bacterium]